MGRRQHRFLKSEQLESRRPLAADLAALDINNDMSVTALDALIIINEINQRAANGTSIAEAEAQLDCDTNSDGVVTPIDVLNVVNQINSGIIAVPTDSTNTTTPDTDPSVPTDSGDTPLVDSNPGTDVEVVPDDPATDGSGGDSTDPTNQVDETDGDDDVVNQPVDETDDTSEDEPTDDDSSGDDSSDNNSDDDSSTNDPHCDHDHASGAMLAGLLIRGHHGGNLFDRLDANGDGALSSDEVPKALWDHLVGADADSSGSVTEAELTAFREAQRVAAVEAFFEQLDTDGSGTITSADVSRMAWKFLSRADANKDGAITVDELLAVPSPSRWGGHH